MKAWWLLPCTALLLAACEREERHFEAERHNTGPNASLVRESTNQPAMALGGYVKPPAQDISMYDDNAYAVNEGKRLYRWYNCAGCHANGGGGMGPPLMDDTWIYGSSPENIFNTIVQGRPNGMPSFAGKIPTPQIWMLVAYVRSLSGLNTTGARSSRSDHMMMYPGSNSLQDPAKPKQSFHPPASEMP